MGYFCTVVVHGIASLAPTLAALLQTTPAAPFFLVLPHVSLVFFFSSEERIVLYNATG